MCWLVLSIASAQLQGNSKLTVAPKEGSKGDKTHPLAWVPQELVTNLQQQKAQDSSLDDAGGFAPILPGQERDGVALLSSSTSSSNAVDIIL